MKLSIGWRFALCLLVSATVGGLLGFVGYALFGSVAMPFTMVLSGLFGWFWGQWCCESPYWDTIGKYERERARGSVVDQGFHYEDNA